MYLIELMNARHMSRTDLSDLSGVPESTLRDILTGKAQLDRCEAATLYSIAEALDVSIEDILLSYWDELEEANAPDTFAQMSLSASRSAGTRGSSVATGS